MARHIVAVCVVCLLCADHLPCKQHDDSDTLLKTINGNSLNVLPETKSNYVKRHTHGGGAHDHHHNHDHAEDDDDAAAGAYDRAIRDKLEVFMQRIFSEFGDPTTMTMNVNGFESMMKQLDLYRLVTEEPDSSSGSATLLTVPSSEDKVSCINSVDFIKRIAAAPVPQTAASAVQPVVAEKISQITYVSTANNNSSSNSNNKPGTISSGSNNSSNSSSNSDKVSNNKSNNSSTLDRLKESMRIDRDDLFNLCPVVLAALTSKTSLERAGCIDPNSVPRLFNGAEESMASSGHHHHHGHGDHQGSIDVQVWVYSSLAVLGVSLCGLLGVAVIPCMDKHIYQHVLQLLVALAVGTLCGDALLHLLPHAMIQQTMANPHDEMMFKGLAAVAGIVFFYFMERLFTVASEWYKSREKKDKPSSRVRVMRDPEASSLHALSGGEKQCKHKYSSYPYCYDEIAMDTKDDHHEHNHVEANQHHHHNNHNNASAKCANHGEHNEHTNDYVKEDPTNLDNNTVSTNLDDASIESEQVNNHHNHNHKAVAKIQPETYTIILREHETKHHGHSHTHGHVHSPPESLSAVVWMVIMGDGLHNFTDGMTIGAAFANNIAGGFSTAIAVFCHELPHELGDFAVLLKAGMSARDAVYYNLLSSILSFVGMLIGIVIGHQPEVSAWVFAVAAGLFLYIALVDMIPELVSAHGTEKRCKTSEFLLQFFGMSAGFGIMLLIAMYEHDLKEMFVD